MTNSLSNWVVAAANSLAFIRVSGLLRFFIDQNYKVTARLGKWRVVRRRRNQSAASIAASSHACLAITQFSQRFCGSVAERNSIPNREYRQYSLRLLTAEDVDVIIFHAYVIRCPASLSRDIPGTVTFQPNLLRTSSANESDASASPWVMKTWRGGFLEIAEPAQETVAIGVAGNALNLLHFRPHQPVDAVDADLAVAVEDLTAERALGLVADERIVQAALPMLWAR